MADALQDVGYCPSRNCDLPEEKLIEIKSTFQYTLQSVISLCSFASKPKKKKVKILNIQDHMNL
jgi:hypothetical protein